MNTETVANKLNAEWKAKNDAKLKAEHETVLKHQQMLLKLRLWRSCINCDNFNIKEPRTGRTMICQLYQLTPPAEIIVNSCEKWINDDIPF